jgi:hypothetical protein
MTGATSGAGTAYHSGTPEFTLVYVSKVADNVILYISYKTTIYQEIILKKSLKTPKG